MTAGNSRGWREICEEVLREKRTERVNALLEELLDVLEERERAHGRPSTPREL